MANVLVIGSGGREYTLADILGKSPSVERVFVAPGIGGSLPVINDPTNPLDFDGIARLVTDENIDLTVVGPEAPLCEGIVDFFRDAGLTREGHYIFGPSAEAAELEGSKIWAKQFMKRHRIPTADFQIFEDPEKARAYIRRKSGKMVVKADGLAGGKGAIVCRDRTDALDAVHKIMVDKAFGDSGNSVLIEDFMEGEEASIHALVDGRNFVTLISSQDHKAAFGSVPDRERWLVAGGSHDYVRHLVGPNTGGMGAYAPAPVVTPDVMNQVYGEVLRPIVDGMACENLHYYGVLYAGLMIKDGHARVVEINCRFGDPEAQVVLPMIDTSKVDMYNLLMSCTDGTLADQPFANRPGSACCVVMASGGYPGSYEKGKLIKGLENVPHGVKVIHSGTKMEDGTVLTAGTRVLSMVSIADSIEKAVDIAYSGVNVVRWDGEYHRMDIAKRAMR